MKMMKKMICGKITMMMMILKDEETAIDEDEASEEEETEGEDDEEDSEEDDEQIVTNKDKVSKKDAIEEENKKENAKVEKEIANGDEGEAVQHNVQKVEVNLKANISKGKRENNKAREESSKKSVTIEKPKSSIVRKGKKRVENMGMIFMCSSNTKNDCFKYMVLGLSESRKNVVENIYPGMRLFLYDIDLKLMYGIFKARERGGYNIEPKAFKSKFPSQVRFTFTVLADCLPLAEEKFKKVIKENYFTKKKFDCQLNSEQVKNLCKLFKSTSKGIQPKKLPRSRKAEERPIPIRGEGYRKRQAEDKRQPIPLRGEGSRKRRTDDKRCPERKEKIRHVELSRKRPRKAISPVARSRQILPPSSVPSIALDRNLDVDPYRRDPYLESRDREPYRHDPYESRRDRPIERCDPYLEHSRESYREERVPYLDRRDPFREGWDPHLDLRASYIETRESYPDLRIRYTDGLDPYPDTQDTYRDDRGVYIERRVYMDEPYRRNPLPESRDVYREDRGGGVVYRDSNRSRGVVDSPLSLESRRHYDFVSRDHYVSSYQALPSITEPLYSSQYPSRSYRL